VPDDKKETRGIFNTSRRPKTLPPVKVGVIVYPSIVIKDCDDAPDKPGPMSLGRKKKFGPETRVPLAHWTALTKIPAVKAWIEDGTLGARG